MLTPLAIGQACEVSGCIDFVIRLVVRLKLPEVGRGLTFHMNPFAGKLPGPLYERPPVRTLCLEVVKDAELKADESEDGVKQ